MIKSKEPPRGWSNVADWYDKLAGAGGHTYQQELILPRVTEILKRNRVKSVLDLACGQGVLARALPASVDYCGADIAPALVQKAQQRNTRPNCTFLAVDCSSEDFGLEKKDFSAAAILLAIQDVKEVEQLLRNAAGHLAERGILIIVMNHPCFRIPRQSQWHIDEANKMQSRLLKSYMSLQEIPISVNPGLAHNSETVNYYHRSLGAYSKALFAAGFAIEELEEWVSNKVSSGAKARMENRARQEFPLFICLVCRKTSQGTKKQERKK